MAQSERLAVLVGPKGRGSNMVGLIEACRAGAIPAEPFVVVSPSGETPAADWVRSHDVALAVVAPGEGYGERLAEALKGATVLCLAGYLRLLPAEVLAAFPGRVLNIHPALLPKFGGKGMYGIRVHEAVLAAGETESGCTVHYVNEQYDDGAIILQSKCEVRPDDTPETLAARVLKLEHQTYPAAVERVLRGG